MSLAVKPHKYHLLRERVSLHVIEFVGKRVFLEIMTWLNNCAKLHFQLPSSLNHSYCISNNLVTDDDVII